MKKIWDISREITKDTPVYPGDVFPAIRKAISFEKGHDANISSIKFSLHTATHIDAPSHFIKDGKTIDEMDLSFFCGPAKVFEVKTDKLITHKDIKNLEINKDDIILFKTSNSDIADNTPFNHNYVALDMDAAIYLAKKEIKTVGIDYLSIESFASESSVMHKYLLSKGIGLIEGLNLKNVKEGSYILSCLPLKIMGVEASPARAVLIEE